LHPVPVAKMWEIAAGIPFGLWLWLPSHQSETSSWPWAKFFSQLPA